MNYSVKTDHIDKYGKPVIIEKGKGRFTCSWDFIPFIEQYALKLSTSIDEQDLGKSKYPFCEYYEIVNGKREYRRCHRIFVDTGNKGTATNLAMSVGAALRILDSPNSLSDHDKTAIKDISQMLQKSEYRTIVKDNACTVVMSIRDRKQECKIRTYNGLTLLTAKIGKMSSIRRKPRFMDEDEWNNEKFRKWIHDENARLKYGYLSIKENELRLSERVFSLGMASAMIEKLLIELSQMANNYRLHLFGN